MWLGSWLGLWFFVVRVLVGIRGNIARLGDATDRKAVGLIVRVLWVGIITVVVQVPGVGSGVRACRPEVAVRTLIVNLTVSPVHVA